MKSWHHALIGAAGAVAPDAALVLFGWRRVWLVPEHPLVRAHRFLHSWRGAFALFMLGWLTHIIADYFTHPRRP